MRRVSFNVMIHLHMLRFVVIALTAIDVVSVWADTGTTGSSTISSSQTNTFDLHQRRSRSPILSYIRNPAPTRNMYRQNTLTNPRLHQTPPNQRHYRKRQSIIQLSAAIGSSINNNNKYPKLTPLPLGLSPFDKSISKTYDVQSAFRTIALTAIQKAISDPVNKSSNKIYEIEIPPLLSNGIDMSKNQFDDFDNVQELNANRNWCIQLIPKLLSSPSTMNTDVVWFILPDDKECEIAKNEYVEQLRYQSTKTIQFTSIRAAFAATAAISKNSGGGNGEYKKAWGSSLAETMNKLQGGDGILADSSTLDQLDVDDTTTDNKNNNNNRRRRIQLICQPGNGGPVEDWINVEQFCYNTIGKGNTSSSKSKNHSVTATIIVNGALDKVRDGYYPPIFFPALAKTMPFYQKQCESILFVKPITDKGLYGWIYRVYPEPWQIILQLPRRQKTSSSINDDDVKIVVDDIVVLVSDTRPSYQEAVNAMIQEAQKRQ